MKRTWPSLSASVVWVVLSLFQIDMAASRVMDLRAAGLRATPWLYGRLVVWSLVLLFWSSMGYRAWRRKRAVDGGSAST